MILNRDREYKPDAADALMMDVREVLVVKLELDVCGCVARLTVQNFDDDVVGGVCQAKVEV